jgi:hypothetical protein
MKLLSALGVLAGGFLLVPKGIVALAVIWTVGKFNPMFGAAIFAVFIIMGGAR